jgi:divalent metal cation (Fe/Co/Zn/Cd) transporter
MNIKTILAEFVLISSIAVVYLTYQWYDARAAAIVSFILAISGMNSYLKSIR